jgi:hypothetical protein
VVRPWPSHPSHPSHEVRTTWRLRRQCQSRGRVHEPRSTVAACRRLLGRLSQPSSAAGLAALLALLVPRLAEHAPAIVDLVLTVIAVGAAIVAMVRCECRDCIGR